MTDFNSIFAIRKASLRKTLLGVAFLVILTVGFLAAPGVVQAKGGKKGYSPKYPQICACGPLKTEIVPIVFTDQQTNLTLTDFTNTFKSLNNTFYQESYHKTWLAGGAHDWVRLGKSMASYGPLLTDSSRASAADPVYAELLADAQRATSWRYVTEGTYQIYVFSGNLLPYEDAINKYTIIGPATNMGAYLFAYGRMLGLPYLSAGRASDPTHGLDIMGSPNNTPEFSAFNRIQLGWISSSMIYKVNAADLPSSPITIASLDSVDTAGGLQQMLTNGLISSTTRVIEVTWGALLQYALVEKRGFDVYVSYIDKSGIGISYAPRRLTLEKPYMSQHHNFSVVLLQPVPTRIMISTPAYGSTATQAITALNEAKAAVHDASRAGRVQGLDQANATLTSAWQSYYAGDLATATQLATQAIAAAKSSTLPQAYYTTSTLLTTVKNKISFNHYNSTQAASMRDQAISLYKSATKALAARDYATANQLAQQALSIMQQASAIEQAAKQSAAAAQKQAPPLSYRQQASPYVSLAVIMLMLLIVLIPLATWATRKKPETS